MKPERLNKFLFDRTLELMKPNSLVLEFGCVRDSNPKAKETDGWSTLRWLEANQRTFTVDRDEKAFEVCKEVIGEYSEVGRWTKVICDLKDIPSFAKEFPYGYVDLLYVDAADGEVLTTAVESTMALMSEKSLVLIDDIDGTDRGELLPPILLRNGYKLEAQTSRQLLYRRDSQ